MVVYLLSLCPPFGQWSNTTFFTRGKLKQNFLPCGSIHATCVSKPLQCTCSGCSTVGSRFSGTSNYIVNLGGNTGSDNTFSLCLGLRTACTLSETSWQKSSVSRFAD